MKYIFLLMFLSINAFAGEQSLDDVVKKIDSDKSYRTLVSQCPVEFFPKSNVAYKNFIEYCSVNASLCLELCNKGDANYCSSLANYTQNNLESEYYSEALFSKACKLGLVSACTNRASGLIKYNGDASLDCAVKTFELACSQKDEWGCTMFGAYLAQGQGVERDFNRALEVLKVSCKNGIEDPACQYAQSISNQIKAVLREEQ
ncbi:hypothetical protein N474_14665 [Pseudoalteromonas luteoviolacea CPMOR-2]|uniref:Beta-lactamase n=1 Tax=Pseudoalteromonas luteoviolacea DSM 6061 TaxID=1365250 RepID=A0A166YRE8_9GAMM|nr:sel1 repeat family protein [Pseudoalteromonas luteoviolacea]KZN43295.1 hypothetical protein N475_09335 [Pseudoalteromonas luteoviolacea DSM 6061]KZN55627.1 hypothetical protein N474_14665 [Pseudoalteromonas luteoviolacea CPMOR-2]MBE0385436.1 hypothetical protein [Pseudoalteromonas luteoviolacea DSM 6061]